MNLLDYVIDAKLVTGPHADKSLMTPRIPIILSDKLFPFVTQWRQFPVWVC